jgi:serine/threonine-protein kinase HipA
MQQVIPKWKELLEISFLSEDMKEKYLDLLETKTQMFK